MDKDQIYAAVNDRYSAASRGTGAGYGKSVSKSFAYSEEELSSIPKDANLGLSCGNPLAIASIREAGRCLYLKASAGDTNMN